MTMDASLDRATEEACAGADQLSARGHGRIAAAAVTAGLPKIPIIETGPNFALATLEAYPKPAKV